MKRLVFAILMMVMTSSLFAQQPVHYSDLTADKLAVGKGSQTVQGNITVDGGIQQIGEANVRIFGAKGDGFTDDAQKIQMAIDSVEAEGGGTVVLPRGSYLTGSTLRITKNNVGMRFLPGAALYVPTGWDDTVLVISGYKYDIDGIKIIQTGNTIFKGVAVAIVSYDYSHPVYAGSIRNFLFVKPGTAFDLLTVSDGWVNANTFQNGFIESFIVGLKTRESVTSAGIASNLFSNVTWQCQASGGDTTRFVIDTLVNYWNVFNSCFVWNIPTIAKSILGTSSGYTQIIGGNMGVQLTDLGTDNTIYSPSVGVPLTLRQMWASDSLIVGNFSHSGVDRIIIQGNSGGNAAIPGGDVAIRFRAQNNDAGVENNSARIVAQNSSNDDRGSTVKIQTHGRAASSSYVDALILDPEGNAIINGSIIVNGAYKAITDSVVDWKTGNTFGKTISGDQRLRLYNAVSGQSINVAITTTGSYVVTWVDAVTWHNNVTPTQTASKTDIYTFIKIGTTIYGSVSQNY